MSFSSDEIRRMFVDYFVERGHEHVSSSSLVPAEDPTLLFTNAGMNQFKSVFLGEATRSYERAVTVQKCMRVSGKHNDLETVGQSLYHHTFFEMLGNFSFGDYFKREAILYAWELITEVYGFPRDDLWATVYEEDDEAWDLWLELTDVPRDQLARLGADENYWAMGETGPCGPCSEIHYDYGAAAGCGRDDCDPSHDCGRFVELWNLVFMQFNAEPDGSKVPLPSPNIDTGAGLERLTAVLQGTRDNYATDLFEPIIAAVAEEVGTAYGDSDEGDVALRVIGDHSRALAFLLADGVMPANEGRGYVLRRLLRRAMRFGMKIGFEEPFLHRSALRVVEHMGGFFGELQDRAELIERVVLSEERRFVETLAAGSRVFNELVASLRESGEDTIPGEEAFKLYDTYGLPLELTREFAEAEGLDIDEAGYQAAMERQRSRARSARKEGRDPEARRLLRDIVSHVGETEFVGYDTTEVDGAHVLAILRDGERVDALGPGRSGDVIVDRTPFYAESGGQVGDRGEIRWDGGRGRVQDAQRPVAGIILHAVEVDEGRLEIGTEVELRVREGRRLHTMRNHTATHLLHAALRDQLGEHVRQAGSLVEPERLRFDFTHYEAVDHERIEELERAVNEAIRADIDLRIDEMAYDEAMERGALAFFGEKYGDEVRVVTVPGVSTELCGGTHVDRTGQIGAFVITHEESVAAGTRRIEALTGEAAVRSLQHYRRLVREAASRAKTPEEQLPEQVARLAERAQEAERELERLRLELASRRAHGAAEEDAVEVDGVRILRQQVDGLDSAGLRNLVDELKSRVGSGVVVIGTRRDGKAALVVGVTSDVTDRVAAGDLVRRLAEIVGGGGGGRPEMAQAGGPDGEKLDEALDRAPELVRELLEA